MEADIVAEPAHDPKQSLASEPHLANQMAKAVFPAWTAQRQWLGDMPVHSRNARVKWKASEEPERECDPSNEQDLHGEKGFGAMSHDTMLNVGVACTGIVQPTSQGPAGDAKT